MDQSLKRTASHLKGETRYIDDLDKPNNVLYGFIYRSNFAYGKIEKIDIEEAKRVKDVFAILSYKDIPGKNFMGAVFDDEPILAEEHVEFIGQAILLIAAKSKSAAFEAITKIKVDIKELEPVLDVEESYTKGNFPFDPLHIVSGDVEEGFAKSDFVIEGVLNTGCQEHFYLETQAAMSVPKPDGTILVKTSSQNPSENQLIISHALKLESSKIEVVTDIIGGGFGGKETQSNWCAVWTSLLANHCAVPVIMVMDRREDMLITGKRHPVKTTYKAGFNKNGRLNAYSAKFLFDIGFSADLSRSIIERSLLHLDNSYYIPSVKCDLYPCRTNKPSNTAFRGFGAPQSIAAIEYVMEEISRVTGIDAAVVRNRNFYGKSVRNTAPYGQKIKDNIIGDLYKELLKTSDYKQRVKSLKEFNKSSKWKKRGISMVPVKFGISFTTSFLNQGAALVNMYKDGSLVVHQGGVEMGQGLYDKMMNVVSREFGITKESVRICSTNISVIPNTSATAASTGSDINGHAIKLAIDRLKNRLNDFISLNYSWGKEDIVWENSFIFSKKNPEIRYPISEIIKNAYLAQVSLSEQAYYKTPGIHFDRVIARGNPFYYYVFGLSVSEVEVDMLTGAHKIIRTDILHDVGESLDKLIDKGQIEGAFVQCSGWATMEELVYNSKGALLTASPDSYKIPGIADIPQDFRVNLYEKNPFNAGILKSRAVGEPPFIYGLSVWLAIKNALIYFNKKSCRLDLPATKEKILKCAYSYVESDKN
ncbi:MAG: xanthine dehydrogenase molybdopterin binding subunit [Bacteroidetes bacterium GWF2_40_14]|nr:MAG: xanthine dehydrogenase molybdopterin binding subunit [Bacteroidetes bacterium GWF2_40_14]